MNVDGVGFLDESEEEVYVVSGSTDVTKEGPVGSVEGPPVVSVGSDEEVSDATDVDSVGGQEVLVLDELVLMCGLDVAVEYRVVVDDDLVEEVDKTDESYEVTFEGSAEGSPGVEVEVSSVKVVESVGGQ